MTCARSRGSCGACGACGAFRADGSASAPPDAEREAVLVEARWMLEELRVSLFAQTLGTSRKVSLQRISKLVAKL